MGLLDEKGKTILCNIAFYFIKIQHFKIYIHTFVRTYVHMSVRPCMHTYIHCYDIYMHVFFFSLTDLRDSVEVYRRAQVIMPV